MQCVQLLLLCTIVAYVGCEFVEVSLANAELDCDCEDSRTCIRKCCEPGHIIPDEVENCTYVDYDRFKVNITQGLLSNNPKVCYKYGVMDCKDQLSFYRLDPSSYDEDKFEIRSDGKLWATTLASLYNSDEYCLEDFEDIGMTAYLCVRAEAVDSSSVYALGMMVSLPFLFITFIVHVLLPIKTIHTKCLIGFVLSLFSAYTTLIVIEYYRNFTKTSCYIIGMICVLSFMTSFLWTNAMSFDIWLTFSGRTRGFGRNRQKAEQKRFWYYFGYTYGLGNLHIIIILLLTAVGNFNSWYNPMFGEDKCWFQGNVGLLLYFYGPLATILIINVVFFGLTAWKIRKTQKDTAVLRKGDNKSHSDEEQRFNVFLKLLLAMGGNWSLEVISFVWEWSIGEVPSILSYLVDFCNVLYGVIIFFLFTLKRTHWMQLQKRYACLRNIKTPKMCQEKGKQDVPLS